MQSEREEALVRLRETVAALDNLKLRLRELIAHEEEKALGGAIMPVSPILERFKALLDDR